MVTFFMVWYVMMVMWMFSGCRFFVRRIGTKFLGRWAPRSPVTLRYLLLLSLAWPVVALVDCSISIFDGIKSLGKPYSGEKW